MLDTILLSEKEEDLTSDLNLLNMYIQLHLPLSKSDGQPIAQGPLNLAKIQISLFVYHESLFLIALLQMFSCQL